MPDDTQTPVSLPVPIRVPAWESRVVYMRALHELQKWARRELDRVQVGEPPSDALPEAWAQVERERAGLVP